MPTAKQKIKRLGNRTTLAGIVFVCALFLTFSAKAVFASDITPETIIKLTNDSRVANNETALTQNTELTKAAQAKAQDMISNDYFAHVSPQGKSPWYWIDKSGYDYRYAGENLAINFTNAEDQQTAWMNSPTHRENILNQKYQDIGVASAKGMINGNDAIVSVVMFGTSMDAAPIPATVQNNTPVVNASEVAKPVVSPVGNNFDKAGAVSGNFNFATLSQTYGNYAGWAMMILALATLLSIDAIIVIHRKHIKPVFVQQALQNRNV